MTAPRVLAASLDAAGARTCARLPFEHVHGDLAATVRARWTDVDAFVLCCATGIAVRVVGPLLDDKSTDPAVVCVDEADRFAVALCGGHAGGANDLARQVAALLDATPVVTTATDAAGVPALDALPGFVAMGDVAGVARAWLDRGPPAIGRTLDWPVPFRAGDGPHRVMVTDQVINPGPGQVVLHPPSLVVGVGASSDAPADAASGLLQRALAGAGLAAESVGEVATLDRRAGDAVVTALHHPVRAFDAATLAAVDVPHPSPIAAAAVGTPSVAEAAALAAAGPGAELVVAKQKAAAATVAVARRRRPPGRLTVVGLGPGHPRHRTPAAAAAVRGADVVIGYEPYVEQCADLVSPAQLVVRSPIGAETDRCAESLDRAAGGANVALVCSGDPGVYAMAGLAHQLAPRHGGPPIEVVPGVTAAAAAAALLGAPLAHDHAVVSLSDLLTPWRVIERRLQAVAAADVAVALYNPRSARRTWQLDAARSILLDGRPPATPVGIVTDATRPGERVILTTLADLDPTVVGMLSIVVVGSTATTVVDGRIVTPRGYAT
ncbi:MAG TPA: precorrin-3B C(17)-methyltransferase [Acidimicrobiales bacterium]|nr:precorrin-3B C(17)-methyltransferase [Acidimicrobiales bacterium]